MTGTIRQRERRARYYLGCQRYALRKSRKNGSYMIIDPDANVVMCGPDLTLEQVEDFYRDE